MQPKHSLLQNDFLNAIRKEQKRVEVYLVSGIKLTGSIAPFDQFVVLLSAPGGGMQTIYKSATSTVQLQTGARPSSPDEAPTRAVTRDANSTTPHVGMRKHRFVRR
jgi:host factor-I protein